MPTASARATSETTMARTDGDRGGWGLIAGLAALAVVQPMACGEATSTDGAVDPSVVTYLKALGPRVLQPAIEAARAAAEDLVPVAAGLADADEDDLLVAYADASDAWQAMEVYQVHPGESTIAPWRDEAYSWPTTSPCRVDQAAIKAEHTGDGFDDLFVNAVGLDALEFLLFADPAETPCPEQVDIVAEGTFDDLSEAQRTERRAAYAEAVAERLVEHLQGLEDQWGAGTELPDDTEAYGSQLAALNKVFDAAFYLETRVKDRKLGRPLGLYDCPDAACLDEVESPFAGFSTRWISENLDAFDRLVTADDGHGLDDVLIDLGHPDVAADLLEATTLARSRAATLQAMPVDQLVVEQRAQTEQLHAEVKAITDILKGDVATILTLRVPTEAAGDND